MHAQIPSHLRNRLARLPDNPNRALLKLLIKRSSLHRSHFLIAMSPRYEGKPRLEPPQMLGSPVGRQPLSPTISPPSRLRRVLLAIRLVICYDGHCRSFFDVS
jgi:hypothetical protein